MYEKKRFTGVIKRMVLLLSILLAVGINSMPLPVYSSNAADAGAEEYEAELTIGGVTTKYKELVDAWKEAQEYESATICLLKDVDLTDKNTGGMYPGDDDNLNTLFLWKGNITLEMKENVRLYSTSAGALIQVMDGTFTLKNGNILNENEGQPSAFLITGGKTVIENGNIKSQSGTGLTIYSNANVNIYGGTFSGGTHGLKIEQEKGTSLNINISGGEFSGNTHSVECLGGITIGDILANGYAFAFKDKNDEWVKSMEKETIEGDITTKQYPMKFNTHPKNVPMVYNGEATEAELYAEAVKTDETAVEGPIEYQWYQKTANGYEPIDEAKGENYKLYKPQLQSAGTYEYYCEAKCDWFKLDSDPAVVTVEKRPLRAEVQGEIVKVYDGTAEADAASIPLICLNNALENDSVTVSAVKAVFPSEQPGSYEDVEVSFSSLEGDDAANYELSETVTVKGRIEPLLIEDMFINKDNLSLYVGDSEQLTVSFLPEHGTDQTVSWISGSPEVAAVDNSGKVTAIGEGSTDVTVTSADGNHSAVCSVTVSRNDGGGSGSSSGGNSGGSSYVSGGGSGYISGGSGSGFVSGGSNAGKPFLIGSPAKQGWDAICGEAARVAASLKAGKIAVDMNGTAVVPGIFFAVIRGSEVTAVFEMGDGIVWSVYGKDISSDTMHDMDTGVKMDTDTIPKDLIEHTAGGCAHLELCLAHEGAFGFTAVLTVRIGGSQSNAADGSTPETYEGMYANLFSYNPVRNSLEFICAGRIREDGTVSLPLAHASDYTVILSVDPMDDTDAAENPSDTQEGTDPGVPQEPAETARAQVKSVSLSKTVYTYSGKAKKPSVIAVGTDGKRISEKDYSVTYKNNRKAGKAVAEVTFKNSYSGTVKKTFTIRPAGTSIKKITAARGGFTVRWLKKTAQASGYQIQYSENAGFQGDSTHSVFVKNPAVAKKTVKNLNAGKTYYVRIRIYKDTNAGGKSTRLYSAWSKKQAVNCGK